MSSVIHVICIIGWSLMLARAITWKQIELVDRIVTAVAFVSLILASINELLESWK